MQLKNTTSQAVDALRQLLVRRVEHDERTVKGRINVRPSPGLVVDKHHDRPSTASEPEFGKVTFWLMSSALPSVNRREDERTRRKSIAICEEASICSGVRLQIGGSPGADACDPRPRPFFDFTGRPRPNRCPSLVQSITLK